jgi:hypothetical protein
MSEIRKPRYDLTGQEFHNWTVIERAVGHKRGGWLCRCACGTERIKRTELLTGTGGKVSKSCGCKQYIDRTSNGMRKFWKEHKIMKDALEVMAESYESDSSDIVQRARERWSKGDIDKEYVMLLAREVASQRETISRLQTVHVRIMTHLFGGFKDSDSTAQDQAD